MSCYALLATLACSFLIYAHWAFMTHPPQWADQVGNFVTGSSSGHAVQVAKVVSAVRVAGIYFVDRMHTTRLYYGVFAAVWLACLLWTQAARRRRLAFRRAALWLGGITLLISGAAYAYGLGTRGLYAQRIHGLTRGSDIFAAVFLLALPLITWLRARSRTDEDLDNEFGKPSDVAASRLAGLGLSGMSVVPRLEDAAPLRMKGDNAAGDAAPAARIPQIEDHAMFAANRLIARAMAPVVTEPLPIEAAAIPASEPILAAFSEPVVIAAQDVVVPVTALSLIHAEPVAVEPIEMAEHVEVVAEPVSFLAAEHETVAAAEPIAFYEAEPELVAAAEPIAFQEAEHELVAVAEPMAYQAAEPEPVAVAEPVVFQEAEPEPVAVAEPIAFQAAEPEPVAVAEPIAFHEAEAVDTIVAAPIMEHSVAVHTSEPMTLTASELGLIGLSEQAAVVLLDPVHVPTSEYVVAAEHAEPVVEAPVAFVTPEAMEPIPALVAEEPVAEANAQVVYEQTVSEQPIAEQTVAEQAEEVVAPVAFESAAVEAPLVTSAVPVEHELQQPVAFEATEPVALVASEPVAPVVAEPVVAETATFVVPEAALAMAAAYAVPEPVVLQVEPVAPVVEPTVVEPVRNVVPEAAAVMAAAYAAAPVPVAEPVVFQAAEAVAPVVVPEPVVAAVAEPVVTEPVAAVPVVVEPVVAETASIAVPESVVMMATAHSTPAQPANQPAAPQAPQPIFTMPPADPNHNAPQRPAAQQPPADKPAASADQQDGSNGTDTFRHDLLGLYRSWQKIETMQGEIDEWFEHRRRTAVKHVGTPPAMRTSGLGRNLVRDFPNEKMSAIEGEWAEIRNLALDISKSIGEMPDPDQPE